MHPEKEEFRYTWKIENFSLSPQKVNEALQSPSFSVGKSIKKDFHLKLYPRGKMDGFIVCDLVREDDVGPERVTVDSKFSLIMEKMPPLAMKSQSTELTRFALASHKLVTRAALFQKRNLFLPNETLTIQCDISTRNPKGPEGVPVVSTTRAVRALVRCLYDDQKEVPNELYSTTCQEIMELKGKLRPNFNSCLALTRIGLEIRSFVWRVKKFSSLETNRRLAMPVMCSSKRVPQLLLHVYLKEDDESFQIEVRKLGSDIAEPYPIACRIILLDIFGNEHLRTEEKHTFGLGKADQTWSFCPFFTRKKVLEDKCLCLLDDVLSLHFTFALSTGVELSRIEEYKFLNTLACESSTDIDEYFFSDEFENFFENSPHAACEVLCLWIDKLKSEIYLGY